MMAPDGTRGHQMHQVRRMAPDAPGGARCASLRALFGWGVWRNGWRVRVLPCARCIRCTRCIRWHQKAPDGTRWQQVAPDGTRWHQMRQMCQTHQMRQMHQMRRMAPDAPDGARCASLRALFGCGVLQEPMCATWMGSPRTASPKLRARHAEAGQLSNFGEAIRGVHIWEGKN